MGRTLDFVGECNCEVLEGNPAFAVGSGQKLVGPEPELARPFALDEQRWIVVCSEGYTSSLAADALLSLGIPATDIDGGFVAWRDAGLPTADGETPVDQLVPDLGNAGNPVDR